VNESNNTSSILIITGMHRSGTSLLASLLQSSGLHIGSDLLKSGKGNVKGHFEDNDFLELHRIILKSQRIHQDGWTLQDAIEVNPDLQEHAEAIVAKNEFHRIWGWKDPRTSLFLDFWLEILPEANFVFVYRPPWEVVDSLYRRNTDLVFRKRPELAIQIWTHYNKKIIRFYKENSKRCLLFNVYSVMEDLRDFIATINQKFRLSLEHPSRNIYDATLFSSVTDLLRVSLIKTYAEEALLTYKKLEELSDITYRFENTFLDHPTLKSKEFRWFFEDWKDRRCIEDEIQNLNDEIEQLKRDTKLLKE
jgi:hypothetical protein